MCVCVCVCLFLVFVADAESVWPCQALCPSTHKESWFLGHFPRCISECFSLAMPLTPLRVDYGGSSTIDGIALACRPPSG